MTDSFAGRRMLLLGRGATALMLLYETLGCPGGRVILPAIGCPSILASALLGGMKPVIVDVDRNLNIDPEKVRKIIKPGDMVLAIHIFGIPCAIEELEEICRENDAILIEDAAQAIGGFVNGRPIGSFGRAAILSFASGKILPTSGGGAILTEDEKLIAKLEEKIEGLPKRPDDLIPKARKLRDILTDAFNKARLENPDAASLWKSVFLDYMDIYKYAIEAWEIEEIDRALQNLEQIAESRRAGVDLYRRYLGELNVEILDYPPECSPYRFAFILPRLRGEKVRAVTEAIRDEGMHASNLYIPLHWLAPGLVEEVSCQWAEVAGIHVINLWLDDGIPESDASRVAEIIGKWTD